MTSPLSTPPPADSLFDAALVAEPSASPPLRQLVLIGAGNAHLQVLEFAARERLNGVQITLISAHQRAVYSGMIPGVLAGLLSPHEAEIDLSRLCQRAGATLVVDRVVGLDPQTRTLELAHQPRRSFDVASFNLGSITKGELLCRQHRTLVSVKPLANLLDRLEPRVRELAAQHEAAPVTEELHFAVVGGGAAGVELAFAWDRHLEARGLPAQVTLYDGGRYLLTGLSRRSQRLTRRLLERQGIRVELGRRVVGCTEIGSSSLILDDGTTAPCDLALWASGAAPPDVLSQLPLPLSERGFLQIRPTLQTAADLPIFVVGDTADWPGDPLPKSGVYAVRQGPVLWENLRRWLRGEPLLSYEPQTSTLALIACGDGTAILDYRGYAFHGRWAWWLKLWIDRRFVQRFQ
jgi:selenide,water dikinase